MNFVSLTMRDYSGYAPWDRLLNARLGLITKELDARSTLSVLLLHIASMHIWMQLPITVPLFRRKDSERAMEKIEAMAPAPVSKCTFLLLLWCRFGVDLSNITSTSG